MNIIRMTGGLGNQMFQYALYLKLCAQGKYVKMDDITEYELENARPILLWVFGIEYPKASKDEINEITDGFLKWSHRIRRKLFGRKSREYHERDCNFDRVVLEKESAYLTGYFQSEKYFQDIKEEVRRAFTFSDRLWDALNTETERRMRDYLERIQGCNSVSLHVRRGDYLTTSEVYGGICTQEYYEGAVRRMLKSVPGSVFFVLSNDKEWVRDWLPDFSRKLALSPERFVVVEGNAEEEGYMDMLLMSRCRHHILANSSFSWWGAWLNPSPDKIVTAPSKWFNNQDCRDIYTEEMIRISPAGIVMPAEDLCAAP